MSWKLWSFTLVWCLVNRYMQALGWRMLGYSRWVQK
jgi:hypothetical protein